MEKSGPWSRACAEWIREHRGRLQRGSSHESSAFDARSDDKGPEPEGIAVGSLRGRTYAFIALERVGGIVTYDVTSPYAPCLVNSRDFAAEVGDPAAVISAPRASFSSKRSTVPTGARCSSPETKVSGLRSERNAPCVLKRFTDERPNRRAATIVPFRIGASRFEIETRFVAAHVVGLSGIPARV